MRNLIIILSLLISSMAQATGPNFLPEEAITQVNQTTTSTKSKVWNFARVGVPVGVHTIALVNYVVCAYRSGDKPDPFSFIIFGVFPLIGLAGEGYAYWQQTKIKTLQNKTSLTQVTKPNQPLAIGMTALPLVAGIVGAVAWGDVLHDDATKHKTSVLKEIYKNWWTAWVNTIQGHDKDGKTLTFGNFQDNILTWTSHLSIPLNIWTAIVIYKQNTELKRLTSKA